MWKSLQIWTYLASPVIQLGIVNHQGAIWSKVEPLIQLMLILGRSHLIWPKPVVRRWKPPSILVPGVGWRWVPWGQAVQNYVSTHYNSVANFPMLYFVSFVYVPDLTKLCSHQLSCADLVVVGLWVILGCSWFDSTTTSACRDWTAPIWRKINFAIRLLSF